MNNTKIDIREKSMYVITPEGTVYIDWSIEGDGVFVEYWVENENGKS